MAGVAGGSPGTAGAGLLAGTKNSQHSDFSKVKKMKVSRRFNTVKLDSPFSHNQIYAEAEDFDFIVEYISERVNIKGK